MTERDAIKQSVVVGYDGTDEGRDALRLGQDFSRAESTDLIVASIYQQRPLFGLDEELEGRREAQGERFEQAAEQLGHADFPCHFATGDPTSKLIEIAASERAEVLVVGSTHRGRLGRIFLGSTAERLFAAAPCAVAVAPRGYARGEHLGLGIIGVGYDGSPESKIALGHAARIARRVGGVVRLIGVVNQEDPSKFGLRDSYRERFARALAEGVATVSGVPAESVFEEGNPAEVLAEQGIELDLLVVGSRGRGPLRQSLLGSVSGELTYTAPCALLVTPRGSQQPDAAGASPQSARVEV